MIKSKTLCLNMIVKNEMANLERCLGAVVDHIGCWVIGDTGSSDGTQDFIQAFFAERGLPGELHSFPFVNFEQARNEALERAYASKLTYDYLLFDDADMVLVVDDQDFRSRLQAPAYMLLQRTESGLANWHTRLVQRGAAARYNGVTHEYLDVSCGTQRLHGVWYRDFASGANRVDKFQRDIRLLRETLQQDPDNPRNWFYLAQSYRDAGRMVEAVETYAKRAGMGGWDEEAWNARLQEARCLLKLGDEAAFLRAALSAFNLRSHRAEPLYDLARHYRELGMNDASVLFSEAGLAIPRPEQDVLFVEDFVYTAGLREEFSIGANYSRDPARKDRGYAACNWLALSREVPQGSRDLARHNLYHYVQSASEMLPSFVARHVGFTPPDGYRPLNPSVARWGDALWMIQRCVNYTLADGRYSTTDNASIHTRNFLLALNWDLDIESSVEILLPADLPPPLYSHVRGFEDARLFVWNDALWCTSTVRELNPDGWCEMVLARIDGAGGERCVLTDWKVLGISGPRCHEKNWMPRVTGDTLRFIHSVDPARVVDDEARTMTNIVPDCAAEHLRGGSQAVEFDGGWLAITHEVVAVGGGRCYLHRFVWFDRTDLPRAISRPFYFCQRGTEFAAGLAWHPDGARLLVSFGVGDAESWLASVAAADIRSILDTIPLPANAATNVQPSVQLSQHSWLTDADLATFVAGETNRALRSPDAVQHARSAIERAGLPLHPDTAKNWDTLVALYHTITTTDPAEPVLDAGAGKESAYLPALRKLGYTKLIGINLLFNRPEVIDGVHYRHGDITRTDFPDERFGFAACLSVLEHGVDCGRFLHEMARILRPGGHLFVSMNYWPTPMDTGGKINFGVPVFIFTRADADALISEAAGYGLAPIGDVELSCDRRIVKDMGLEYTFANLLFRRT